MTPESFRNSIAKQCGFPPPLPLALESVSQSRSEASECEHSDQDSWPSVEEQMAYWTRPYKLSDFDLRDCDDRCQYQ
jgi:hypothetical protein